MPFVQTLRRSCEKNKRAGREMAILLCEVPLKKYRERYPWKINISALFLVAIADLTHPLSNNRSSNRMIDRLFNLARGQLNMENEYFPRLSVYRRTKNERKNEYFPVVRISKNEERTCMAINVIIVQYNGGFLPDILLLTQGLIFL